MELHSARRAHIAVALTALVAIAGAARADWPADPVTNVPVCTVINLQMLPAIAGDGAGGAIVAWQDARGRPHGHLRAPSAREWPDRSQVDHRWRPGMPGQGQSKGFGAHRGRRRRTGHRLGGWP